MFMRTKKPMTSQFSFTIRPALLKDLPVIMGIYNEARAFMRRKGNLRQWVNGYPQQTLLESDIEHRQLFVLENRQGIYGVFAFIRGNDPTYAKIEGRWLTDRPYGTIHRAASNGTQRRVLDQIVQFCEQQTTHLRIDTHGDNTVMQNLVRKLGFVHCGTIYVEEDNYPRLAYEKT